jgi:hypothetical protein
LQGNSDNIIADYDATNIAIVDNATFKDYNNGNNLDAAADEDIHNAGIVVNSFDLKYNSNDKSLVSIDNIDNIVIENSNNANSVNYMMDNLNPTDFRYPTISSMHHCIGITSTFFVPNLMHWIDRTK